jgi:hypothetical protein
VASGCPATLDAPTTCTRDQPRVGYEYMGQRLRYSIFAIQRLGFLQQVDVELRSQGISLKTSTPELATTGERCIKRVIAGAVPEQGTSLASMYLWVNVFSGLLIAALACSLVRRLRRPLTDGNTWLRRTRRIGPLVWEMGLPILLLAGFPQLFEVHSWMHIMTYTPHLGSLVILAGLLWFATGVTRVVKLRVAVQSRQDRAARRRLQVRPAQ